MQESLKRGFCRRYYDPLFRLPDFPGVEPLLTENSKGQAHKDAECSYDTVSVALECQVFVQKMRIHKSALLLFTIVSVSMASTAAFAQTDTSPISVHLSAPKRVATVGGAIRIEVQVTNRGKAAILVPNSVSMASGGMAYLELELTDTQGRISPRMNVIADSLSVQQSDDDAAAKLLGAWTLLYPHTSLLFDIPIDGSFFKFLEKPGHYKLDATYTSNGISWGRNSLGLSEKLLSSLPYRSWKGEVATNRISLTVESPNKTEKRLAPGKRANRKSGYQYRCDVVLQYRNLSNLSNRERPESQ